MFEDGSILKSDIRILYLYCHLWHEVVVHLWSRWHMQNRMYVAKYCICITIILTLFLKLGIIWKVIWHFHYTFVTTYAMRYVKNIASIICQLLFLVSNRIIWTLINNSCSVLLYICVDLMCALYCIWYYCFMLLLLLFTTREFFKSTSPCMSSAAAQKAQNQCECEQE